MDGSEEEAILASLAELESEGSRGCCIKDCKNSTFRAHVLYFPVPEDHDRRSVWLKLLSEFLSENDVRSQLWICSDHFHSRDIIHTNSEPELAPAALPHIQGFSQLECEDEEDCTGDWTDDQLCFTATKRISAIRMDVEATDTPRSLEAFHRLLQESSQEDAQIEHKLLVKMEPRSEAEDDCSSFLDSVSRGENQDTSQGENSIFTNPRRVKMNISSGVMEKFLKEGKLEKQSNGSYRVMENVLKEIENSIGSQEAKTPEINTGGKPDHISQSQCTQGTVPSNRTAVFRRKRGRPRKGTFIPRTTQSQETATSSYLNQNSASSLQIGKKNSKTNTTSLLIYDSTEDPGDAESESEYKPKRKRRSKVLDDYVTDFNTSDEEDVSLTTNFSKFTNRGRGRGRGRKVESLEAFDDDLFTSYVGVFGKKFSLQEDFPDEGMLEGMSESEGDVHSPSSSNAVKLLNTSKQGNNGKDGLEAMLGQDGRTKIQIVNTGETSIVNKEENLIYHVIATTGKTSTITPLRIPKTADDEPSESDKKDFPSTSQTKLIKSEEGRVDTDVELDGSKPRLSSRGRRLRNKQIIRTYNKQVASLRQRYCRALQELRKRPRVYTLADLVYGASRFLTEDQLVFFTLQLKSGCNNMQAIRFSVREKMLALAFYLQSPALYKWLRVIFHLPTKLILERWLEGIAKSDPDAAKKLMYHVYTRYVFRF